MSFLFGLVVFIKESDDLSTFWLVSLLTLPVPKSNCFKVSFSIDAPLPYEKPIISNVETMHMTKDNITFKSMC